MLILVQRENFVDPQGASFTPTSLKENDGKEVSITDNFNKVSVFGTGKLKAIGEGKGLYIDIDDSLAGTLFGSMPIGFMTNVNDIQNVDGRRVFTSIDVTEVACIKNPVDDTLPKIEDILDMEMVKK